MEVQEFYVFTVCCIETRYSDKTSIFLHKAKYKKLSAAALFFLLFISPLLDHQ